MSSASSTPDSSRRVADAMKAVRREGFLTEEQRGNAGRDAPLPLWDGQTNSQPTTVSNMLELLAVPTGAKVLDVGAGSGWTTALLAHLVGSTGSVLGLEIVPDLARWGAANVEASQQSWARLEVADADEVGRAAEAPYDRILVSAMATTLPLYLVDQLAPGGVMVVPVDGRMIRVERPADGGPPTRTEHGFYRFVPLVTRD
ncbi:protein-L-isoaspartate O-methyltransferase family protein [Mobilicoccus caccae]|uniref:Protein-L-isoaspartate O-methyltransferase n=1 Tax=Mobilicoccus caccae TaxID=1859295 RepID=A0ABQ6ITK1_9MICO|nr:methyltransferase domain-containing protein [Mobilicoccus caccae]GMA41273.1 fibrillarin-like rRNA methylase [Mobilicoccus caccae]